MPTFRQLRPVSRLLLLTARRHARMAFRHATRLLGGSQIRCATRFGELDPFPERQRMHVHRADNVAMSRESALGAYPSPPCRTMATTALGTSGAGVAFTPGEALKPGPLTLLLDILLVSAVFPLGKFLVEPLAHRSLSHAVRIADEHRSDIVFRTERNDGVRRFMSQVAYASLSASEKFPLGPLELLPSPRPADTPALQSRNLAERLVAKSLL